MKNVRDGTKIIDHSFNKVTVMSTISHGVKYMM